MKIPDELQVVTYLHSLRTHLTGEDSRHSVEESKPVRRQGTAPLIRDYIVSIERSAATFCNYWRSNNVMLVPSLLRALGYT